jgi:hypothetical protein
MGWDVWGKREQVKKEWGYGMNLPQRKPIDEAIGEYQRGIMRLGMIQSLSNA